MQNKIHNYLDTSFTKAEMSKLDAWRGILSLTVAIAHCNQIFIAPYTGTNNYLYWTLGGLANVAVIGFFILSGIFITMSIYANLKRNKGELDFKEFFFARVSRIYPPLIFSVVTCIAIRWLIFYFNLPGGNYSFRLPSDIYVARDFFNFSRHDVTTTLKFESVNLINVNGPLWSLIIEWYMYFVAFFLLGVFFLKKMGWKIISFVLMAYLIWKVKSINSVIYLFIWMLGFCFFFIARYKTKILLPLRIVSLLGLLTLVAITKFFVLKRDINELPMIQVCCSLLFISIMFLLPVKSIFNKISNYSYTLYIVHFPVFLFLFSLFHRFSSGSLPLTILLAISAVFFSIAFSYYAHKIVENKNLFNKLLNRFF